MDKTLIDAYIQSAAAVLGLTLDAARAERVAGHLQRTADMAALLEGAELAPHDELAQIYCPAAFKPSKSARNQL